MDSEKFYDTACNIAFGVAVLSLTLFSMVLGLCCVAMVVNTLYHFPW